MSANLFAATELAGDFDAGWALLAGFISGFAQLAVFLASFDSAALTAQSLLVSHGWFME